MQPWNHIINTALLGTDKRQPDLSQLTRELAEAASLIQQHTADKEEQFLQLAAVLFNYRQCGTLPLHKEGISIPKTEAEEKKYCSAPAMQVLKDILEIDNTPLLQFWLQQCAAKQSIVQPEMVPQLFNEAKQQKKLQTLIADCGGKRGQWLSRFNSEWNFSTGSNEEVWQTGTPEQRRNVLQQLRLTDPQKAITWLQQTWPQEDANEKTELLQLLTTNISESDIPFLESLSSEKSKKVKEASIQLLKLIPASEVVRHYERVLAQTVVLKKERSFLGIMKNTSLQVQLPTGIDENIFKTGIQKLSSDKKVSDEEFIISQLIASVPPSFWETQLENNPEDIINIFQKHKSGKGLMAALVQAVVNFNDRRWAVALMQHSDVFYLDILPLIPVQQQEFYSKKFIEQHPDSIIQQQVKREDEWSNELTKLIFKHIAKTTYQYTRAFYNQHIMLFPVAVMDELEHCMPPEEHQRTSWNNMCEHILKLLTLKKQTIKAFNE